MFYSGSGLYVPPVADLLQSKWSSTSWKVLTATAPGTELSELVLPLNDRVHVHCLQIQFIFNSRWFHNSFDEKLYTANNLFPETKAFLDFIC